MKAARLSHGAEALRRGRLGRTRAGIPAQLNGPERVEDQLVEQVWENREKKAANNWARLMMAPRWRDYGETAATGTQVLPDVASVRW
jgi:hypothetical protein